MDSVTCGVRAVTISPDESRKLRATALKGTPAPGVAPSGPHDGCNGAGDGPPPQRAPGGGAESRARAAPRGPKPLPPGTRLAPLPEVAGPQGRAVTVGFVPAGVLLLATPQWIQEASF